MITDKKTLYDIKDNFLNETLNVNFTFEESKEYFKYDVEDTDDKELIIYHNKEIDECENIEELTYTIDMLTGMQYSFIEVGE